MNFTPLKKYQFRGTGFFQIALSQILIVGRLRRPTIGACWGPRWGHYHGPVGTSFKVATLDMDQLTHFA